MSLASSVNFSSIHTSDYSPFLSNLTHPSAANNDDEEFVSAALNLPEIPKDPNPHETRLLLWNHLAIEARFRFIHDQCPYIANTGAIYRVDVRGMLELDGGQIQVRSQLFETRLFYHRKVYTGVIQDLPSFFNRMMDCHVLTNMRQYELSSRYGAYIRYIFKETDFEQYPRMKIGSEWFENTHENATWHRKCILYSQVCDIMQPGGGWTNIAGAQDLYGNVSGRVFASALDMGLNPVTMLDSISGYHRASSAVHSPLTTALRNMRDPTSVAALLYNDICELPMVIPGCQRANIAALHCIIGAIIARYFDFDQADQWNWTRWQPRAELRYLMDHSSRTDTHFADMEHDAIITNSIASSRLLMETYHQRYQGVHINDNTRHTRHLLRNTWDLLEKQYHSRRDALPPRKVSHGDATLGPAPPIVWLILKDDGLSSASFNGNI